MARDSASRANNSSPESADQPRSANGPAASDRAGQDERRRGWFWHWNGIVTQYVPLIGLKGVGLLNSYTVWTDRREDSPHRGYAFPSQQSEANFYGEDRAELITINKILVVLDLIEIRKEMVRKTDEQGRRWKVPQNLYRVKDRQDGLDLTTADVIRVIELADRDKTVYRYIRKIFSARFEPIDRNNVWHGILKEIEDHPTWQKLAARTARQEARASARTKAGHRSRARKQDQPPDGTTADTNDASEDRQTQREARTDQLQGALLTSGHDSDPAFINSERTSRANRQAETIAAFPNSGSDPAVATSNNGSTPTDDESSNGLHEIERGSVADTNYGHESSVEPGNTMYYQSSSTTTTTTTSPPEDDGEAQPRSNFAGDREPDHRSSEGQSEQRAAVDPAVAGRATGTEAGSGIITGNEGQSGGSTERSLAGEAVGGPLGDPSPLVVSLYEAANDRATTRLERILLSELEADAGPPARAAGSTGPDWVAAALREAVGSGSAFVAPKRIREIVNRWAASGSGPRGKEPEVTVNNNDIRHVGAGRTTSQPDTKHSLDGSLEHNPDEVQALSVAADDAAQGERLWDVVLDILGSDSAAGNLSLIRGVVPIGERSDGRFVLGAPTRLAVRLLDGSHRRAVEQALSSLLPSQVTIVVLPPDEWKIEHA
ncbi:hypothetical protein BH23CHL2_BH23CHL2_09840 [soil metagenome]